MLFTNITLLDENFEIKRDQFVGTKNDRIAYIGDTEPQDNYGEKYDGAGKLLMPGLFNAHAHVPMTLLRGYAENLPLDRWLNEKVFPFEAKITDETARQATDLAIAEMLKFGTVSFTDMYYFSEARAEAILESGMKANISYGMLSFDDRPYQENDAYAVNEMLLKNYHNAGDERLKVDFCVHAEYTNTEKVIRGISESAKEHGVQLHIHLSETAKEHEECKQRRNGMTPAAFFDSCGAFDVPVTAAHCVHLEGDDFTILKNGGVTVASCPASNMKLASGFANIPRMLEQGLRVAVGTDGVASNNNHNMFKDLYLFAILSKGYYQDPTVVGPVQTLQCSTRNGALSQGRADAGVIAEGMKADMIVLNIEGPHMHPVTDLINNMVYSAEGSDVCLTMVDGKVLYRNGEYPTIDVERAIYETQKATDAITAGL